MSRDAFTLFELVLAIALSVTLVALIGTAINLYLTQVDASRTEVEEAQLARSVLAMIADDIRAATVYKPQDTAAIQQLLASSASFDVDSIDAPRGGSGGGGSPGGSFGTGTAGTSGTSTSLGGSTTGSTSGGLGTESESTLPLGLNGTLEELYVDSTRLPRREELFSTVTGYSNAPIGMQTGVAGAGGSLASTPGLSRPSDLKTVRYFVRPGEVLKPGSAAATSLSPEEQLRAGGLVRQEISRSTRLSAEQSGNSAVLESGQTLIAPEVVHLEFRYFDGLQVTEYWDMLERNSLPAAIEVSLWIEPLDAEAKPAADRYDPATLANTAHEYRQTIYLPMSALSSSTASGTSGMGGAASQSGSGSAMGSGSSTSSSGSSTMGGSSFGDSRSGF